MSSLRLSGVRFAWGDRPLFSDLDLALGPGWTGLVGANGAGKSTLLAILGGRLRPDAGSVRTPGPVALCPQAIASIDPEILSFRDRQDGLARRLRERLKLAPLARWSTLSGGERKRWQIGAALAAEPALLLLDEPTNHLDADTVAFLLEVLRDFRGHGVLVSHDRRFLDALCERTLRLDGGKAQLYPGSWSRARPLWEAERARREAEREALGAQVRGAERGLREAREAQASAERGRSTRSRMKGPRDHDGASMGRKFLAEKAESRKSRSVALRRDALERAREELAGLRPEPTLGRSLTQGWVRSARPVVCAVEGPVFAGERPLFPGLQLVVEREDRLWLRGPNGVGKSTLLRALAGADDALLYLPQELGEDEIEADLDHARALPAAERGRLFQLVAALGVPPEALLATRRPSPGEARKLRIALGLQRQAPAALLDEPTNHLDLPSIERLEQALADYPGALVVATHDTALAAALRLRPLELAAV